MRTQVRKLLTICGVAFAASLPAHHAAANEPIRLGVSTFLSGAGSVFGVPARHAAEQVAEQINQRGGIKGSRIELVFIDENQGVDNVVTEFRSLAGGKKVDAMVIGLSSSICLAVAPVAEQMQMPTMLWDCGTSRLFEENKYKYVYRTGDFTPANNVAAALYMLKAMPEVKTIAGINQDYAFGRDNWAAFSQAVTSIRPDVKIVAELFPKLGQSDYSTEVSRLAALRPEVVFTTLWGGDMNTFIKQSASRGLFRNSRLVAANGESSMESLGKAFPQGAIVGMRGDSWAFNPAMSGNAEHQKFVDDFRKRANAYPSFPSYHMAQALQAIDKSLSASWDGQRATLHEALLKGWNGLELDDFTGKLAIRGDNQAIEDQLFGIAEPLDGQSYMTLKRLALIPGKLISPPVGAKTDEWARTLTPALLDQVSVPAQ